VVDRPEVQPARPPWLWIGLTALFAVLALALGLWGLSKKNDADDAKAAQQQSASRLAAARRGALRNEGRQQVVEARTRLAYRQVRARFVSERTRAGDFDRDIAVQRDQLAQARQQVANATTADDKATAQLRTAREQADLAGACARGALNAIDRFFEALDLDKAAKRAVASLRKLQGECQDAVGST
jgi:hypothetical protein